jgi:peroxiredoxin Q/BCP
MSQWVEAGSVAPDFTLPADDGSRVALRALRGSPVVLYFYPRDDTPGCTKEACGFRDQNAELTALGARILGVSSDDLESHRKFRDKFALNFPLLADTEHQVAEAYGAWGEKVRFGQKSFGIVRSTFLIDAEGVVRRVWKNVQVDGHDAEVIEALRQLLAAPARS